MIELALNSVPKSDLEDDERPELAPAAAIEETYFVIPVRFNVDGEELLAYPGVYVDWRPVPVLGFATQLRRAVDGLADGHAATITLVDGGALLLKRVGNVLVLSRSPGSISVRIPRDELVRAASSFAREVCDYVLARFPRMATHPTWSNWCPSSP